MSASTDRGDAQRNLHLAAEFLAFVAGTEREFGPLWADEKQLSDYERGEVLEALDEAQRLWL